MTFYTGSGPIKETTLHGNFPTEENPNAMWEYILVHFSLDSDLRQISRQTYSILDWCGDWGGVLDALFLIAEIIVYPYSVSELYS